MLLLLGIAVLAFVFYMFWKSRSSSDYGMRDTSMFGGAGSMATGMILGYLLSNYMINQEQYNAWQGLGGDDLRDMLVSRGILNSEDFDSLSSQANSGDLVEYDLVEAGANEADEFNSSSNFNDYNDGGFDDF